MQQIANQWIDYEVIDAGNGEKLECWKNVTLRRPDPQAVWPTTFNEKLWNNVDGHYHRAKSGGGTWDFKNHLPEHWTIKYKNLTFKVSPTGFKHTGLFPEQACNWDWMTKKIKNSNLEEIRILNLFAYTGGATCACSAAGATEVVHVDASKGMTQWAKENAKLCGLEDNTIRFIIEDCIKFVEREKRRGRTYHGIVMDPPSYGRGPNKEVWKLEEQINELVSKSLDILDQDAIFFLVNSYTTGFSATVLENILKMTVFKKYPFGTIEAGEIGLPLSKSKLILPCGIYGRWSND